MRLILFLILFFISQTIIGQSVNTEQEIKKGIADFQNRKFQSALEHFERAANALPISDVYSSDYVILYYLCGTSASQIGDIKKSTYYIEKCLSATNLPIEYRIPMLCIQLNNYSELYKDCVTIVKELEYYYNNIPTSYKVDILAALLPYYVEQENNIKVIKLEKELSIMITKDTDSNNKVIEMVSWNTIYMTMGIFFEI